MSTLLATCGLAIVMHCMSTMYVESAGHNSEIIDHGFNIIPKLNLPDGTEHVLAFAYPLATLLILYSRNKGDRFLRQGCIIMVLRSLTIVTTILPATKPCTAEHVLDIASKLRGGCHDKIFSGHLAYLTLAVLHLHKLEYSVWHYLAVVVEGILLIGLREHYTVDIVLAVIIAVLVYKSKN